MRVGLFGTVALAIGFLASTSGDAAEVPGTAAAPSLANVCQSGAVAKVRLPACEALLRDPNLMPKLAAPVFFSIGFAQIDLHDPDDALISFTRALDRDPAFWPASWARAQLLDARREYGSAVQDWGQVLSQQPALVGAYVHRADSEDNLGQTGNALADYTKAITTASPGDPIDQFYAGRAATQFAAARFDLAIADFGEAIARNDRDAQNYLGRGRAAFLKGDAPTAAGDLRKAVELDPTNIYAALWLYLAETEAGQDGADGLRGRIGELPLTRWPGPLVRVFLGDAKAEQVQPATGLPPGWSAPDRQAGAACEMAFYMGEYYRLHGQKDQAIASFRAALATHVPEFVEYHAAESELARLGR